MIGVSAGAEEVEDEDKSAGPLVPVVTRTDVTEVLARFELRTVEARVTEILVDSEADLAEDCPEVLEEVDATSTLGPCEVDPGLLCGIDWLGKIDNPRVEVRVSVGGCGVVDGRLLANDRPELDISLVVLGTNVVELVTAVDACTVDVRPICVEGNVDFFSIAQVPVAICAAPMELFSEQAESKGASKGLYTTAAQFTLAVHLRIH